MTDFPSMDFRALFEAAPGLYLVLTPDLRIVAVSTAYLRATMTSREQLLGRGIFEAFPDNPDDPAATGVRNLHASLRRVLETSQPDAMAVQKYDVRRPEAEGGGFEERYWSPLNSPVTGADGKVAYIIHRVEDVTEFIHLKKAGREREQAAQELRHRAQQMEAEIYARAQQVAEANRQLTKANDELAGLYRRIEHLMACADNELRAGEAVPDRPDAIAPEEMLERVGELIAGHRRLAEQLLQAQKMEAVGRLAGGVAHDFNNLLTVITGYSAMLREDPANGGAMSELEEIEKAAQRAAALTHKLLAYSRKQVMLPSVIHLNHVVTGMEEMLRRLLGEKVSLVIVLGRGLGNVKADPNQLEQVIMNLAVNARDAMPGGGLLRIETGSVHLEAGTQTVRPGKYVVLSVTDTGHGMDEQTAARIFEPFFTTKEVGKGTGLGLSTSQGIIEQSSGIIRVETAPGAGTTFRVYLPVDSTEAEQEASDRTIVRQSGAGTILLVEDEPPLRKLVSAILSSAGYRVLEAVNGPEAIARAAGLHIDLLLTDVVMPGMNGPELVKRLRTHRPGLAVLYVSGYGSDLIEQKALAHNASFLPKPFAPQVLLRKIGELLGIRRDAGGGKRSAAS